MRLLLAMLIVVPVSGGCIYLAVRWAIRDERQRQIDVERRLREEQARREIPILQTQNHIKSALIWLRMSDTPFDPEATFADSLHAAGCPPEDIPTFLADAWGQPITFGVVYPDHLGETTITLTSAGPDERFGTPDDIWESEYLGR